MKKIILINGLTILHLFLINICTSAQTKMPETIIYGTVYNVFHDRYASDDIYKSVVDKDIRAIKDANMNIIMPFPFGQWDVETKKQDWKRTDYLVDRIEKNKLMLFPIMLKSTHRAYLPTWKWLEIEDGIREFPQVSTSTEDVKYMHPEIKKAIGNYFETVVQRYGNSPALVGYNIWNEPHYESIDEITIPKFRKWLKEKYFTLTELNRVWAEDYSSWDQITPLLRRNWESSMAAIDWDLFRFDNNGDIAKWCYNTMRKYDDQHFMTINPVGSVITNPFQNNWSVDGRQIAPHTDVFGISFYPDKYYNTHRKPMPSWLYNCIYDVTRCDAGDKPYFLVEAQTNQQNGFGLFQFLSYDDIHLMSWLAFASNCKGIIFWKWKPFYRGQQAFGRGLTTVRGELAPRGQAAKDVGSVLKKYGKLLHDAKIKPAETAIMFDITALLKSFEAVRDPGSSQAANFITQSFEGTYKSLWMNNIPVDVIRTDMPVTIEMLKKYKIVYLPFQLVIRKPVANLLKEYVAQGGSVVADAHTGIMDEFDFGYEISPGAGLNELFAASRLDMYAHQKYFNIELTDEKVFKNIQPGFTYSGINYREKLKIENGGEVLALFSENRDPALVVNHYGQGNAYLSAVPLGGTYYNGENAVGKIISNLALNAGVSPTAVLDNEATGVTVKVHSTENKGIVVYLINTSDNDYNGSISLNGVYPVFESAVNLLNEEKIEFKNNGNVLNIDIKLMAKRSAVLWLK
ncbi:MAG: beta-galactosidase [Bacteroidales bacterium]|nr:beta-galactosidase [Bacteroidales bacterium]